MKKEELLSKLWAEAERKAKARLKIIRICLIGFAVILSYVVLMFHFYSSPNSWVVTSWPLYFVYFMFILLAVLLPVDKISKEKIEMAFYQVVNEAAQDVADRVNFYCDKATRENLELKELKTKNDLLAEILNENTEQIKKTIDLIKNKRK